MLKYFSPLVSTDIDVEGVGFWNESQLFLSISDELLAGRDFFCCFLTFDTFGMSEYNLNRTTLLLL